MIGCKLALIESNSLFRSGLNLLLTQLGHQVVAECGSGKEFIERFESKTAHVETALIDVHMQNEDGITTLQWIKQNKPDIKVIALAMFDCSELQAMLNNGACSFIPKTADPGEIHLTLKRVIKRGFYKATKSTLMSPIECDMSETERKELIDFIRKQIG